jgi:hypothetical protein
MKSILAISASVFAVVILLGAANTARASASPVGTGTTIKAVQYDDSNSTVVVTKDPEDPKDKDKRSKTKPPKEDKEDGHDNGQGNDDKNKDKH